MGQFDGKVLVVTGGGRGIGAATAMEFVRRGGRVALGDVMPEVGQETVEAIGKDKAIFGWAGGEQDDAHAGPQLGREKTGLQRLIPSGFAAGFGVRA